MADTKKQKRPPKIKGTSPVGVFAWPKINKPDFGNDDYPKPDGEFSVVLVMDKDAAFDAFIAKYQPMHDQAVEKARELVKDLKPETRKKLEKKVKGGVTINDLYTDILDQETEEPTGKVKIKFAMSAGGERKDGTKWFARPAAFDAKGQPIPLFFKAPGKPHDGKPIPSAPQIWNGTQGRVAFAINVHDDGTPGYFIPGTGAAGLKLGLEAVKVLVLKSGGDRDASSYGFDGEDEGYSFDGNSDTGEGFGGDEPTGQPDETGGDAPDDGNF